MVVFVSDSEQPLAQLLPVETEMMRHAGKDEIKRTDPQFIVGRNRNMMFPALLRSQAHVAAHLPRHVVPVMPKPPRQVRPRDVPRQLHGSIVSSRTTFTNRSRMESGFTHSSA
jgi:hypothetical protein